MRQLDESEMGRGFEDIGQGASSVRAALEGLGLVFAEDHDSDEPGPTQWAGLALEDGAQYLLVHHYAHPDAFVDIRAIPERRSPKELIDRFRTSLSLSPEQITWIAEHWWHHGVS